MHSNKKRKDSLEVSLDRVLFAAELEFPKILVLRLPQHTSIVNTECAGKSEWSKQLYSRPINSHGFTVCHTVLLPFSQSHRRFFISHDFTNFEQIFFPKFTVF